MIEFARGEATLGSCLARGGKELWREAGWSLFDARAAAPRSSRDLMDNLGEPLGFRATTVIAPMNLSSDEHRSKRAFGADE